MHMNHKNHMKGGRQKSPLLRGHNAAGSPERAGSGAAATADDLIDGDSYATLADPDNPLGAAFDLRHSLVQRNGLYYLAGDQHQQHFATHHPQQQQQQLLLPQPQQLTAHHQILLQHNTQQQQQQQSSLDDVVVGISDLRHESLNQILRQSIEIDHKPAATAAAASKFRDSDHDDDDDGDDANNNKNNNDNNNIVRNDCGTGNHGDALAEDGSFVVSYPPGLGDYSNNEYIICAAY